MTMHYLIFLKGTLRRQMEVSYLVGINLKNKNVQVLLVAHVHFRASLIFQFRDSATWSKNACFATATALKICSG